MVTTRRLPCIAGRPAQHRRTVVSLAQKTATELGSPISERHACRLVGVPRATQRYRPRRPTQAALRQRLRDLASARPRWGYRRLAVLLEREGHEVNHKLVHRLYRDEGLAVRRKSRKRAAVARVPLPAPTRPNERGPSRGMPLLGWHSAGAWTS